MTEEPAKQQTEQTEQGAPAYVPTPPGRDLTWQRAPYESDAAFYARTRGMAVVSESPTDIVPNMPQITMSDQAVFLGPPAEEAPPEAEAAEAPGEDQPAEETTPKRGSHTASHREEKGA